MPARWQGELRSCSLFPPTELHLRRVTKLLASTLYDVVSYLFLCAESYSVILLVALVAVVLPPLLYRSTTTIVANSARNLDTTSFPGGFITPETRISRDDRDGPPVLSADGILIAPPQEHEPPASKGRLP